MADNQSATLCCISLESLNATRTSGGLTKLAFQRFEQRRKTSPFTVDNSTGCHSSETLLIGAVSRERKGIPLSAGCTVHMTFDGRKSLCAAD